jgi:excisionase family DNA binding protein
LINSLERNHLFVADEQEQKALGKIERELEESSTEIKKARLIGASGEEIELPDSLYQLLHQVVYHLIQGKAVSIVPVNKELTTQEAADLLNVSRPYLVKLLESGQINYKKVGTHRRVRFADLMAYKQQFKQRQAELLDEMVSLSEEAGLYD